MKKTFFSFYQIISIGALIAILLTVITLRQQFSHQNIIKINSISEVLKYTDKADLVVFDLDLTLIAPISQDNAGNRIEWGSRYFSAAFKKYIIDSTLQKYDSFIIQAIHSAGINASDSLIKNAFSQYIEKDGDWKMIGNLLEKYIDDHIIPTPVEKKTLTILETLKARGIPILIYTARRWNEKESVEKELTQVDISINKDAVYDKELIINPQENEERGFGFGNGILYWIKNKNYMGKKNASKAPILLKFFETINYQPKQIIIIDDLKDRINDLKQLFKSKSIDATVLWYRGIEKRSKPIDQLSETDLKILNHYFPEGWQYLSFDQNKAIDHIIEQLK